MANSSKTRIFVDASSNPEVEFYNTDSALAKTALINVASGGHNIFKIQKYIDSATSLQDVMTINETGNVNFLKNVTFSGGSAIQKVETVVLQDQTIEIGIASSVQVLTTGASITKVTGTPNRYTFTVADTNVNLTTDFAVNNYIYFSGLYYTPPAGTATPVFNTSNKVTAVTATTITFENTNDYTTTLFSGNAAVFSKLLSITNNTGINILGVNAGSLINGSLSFENSTTNALILDNTSGPIRINAQNGATTVRGSAGVDLQYGTTSVLNVTAADTLTLKANNPVTITHAADSANDHLTISQTGAFDSSIILSSAGTGTSAISLQATAGGITATAAAASSVTTSTGALTFKGAAGVDLQYGTTSVLNVTAADTLTLKPNNPVIITHAADSANDNLTISQTGAFDSSLILTSAGTGATAISLQATAGGITATSVGGITATAAAASSITTSAGALTFKGAAGVDLQYGTTSVLNVTAADTVTMKPSSAVLTHAATADTQNFTISQTGAFNSSLILSSAGTNANALSLQATAGGITATAAAASSITTSAGALTFKGAAGVDLQYGTTSVLNVTAVDTVTMKPSSSILTHAATAAAQNFTISQTGAFDSSLILTSAGTGTSAFQITSTAGGVDVNSFKPLLLNSSDVINVGTTNVNKDINIGTGGTRTINMSQDVAGTILNINAKDVNFKNGTSFTSDRNLKDNFQDISEGLNLIKSLHGTYFTWKNDPSERKLGFIAQEVEAIIPELVKTNENGFKSVDYVSVIPVLVEAIKEQQKQIDELKSKL